MMSSGAKTVTIQDLARKNNPKEFLETIFDGLICDDFRVCEELQLQWRQLHFGTVRYFCPTWLRWEASLRNRFREGQS